MKRIWKDGSVTVEAVFLTIMMLWIVFVILALLFFVYNRAYFTAALSETALKESSRCNWQDREITVERELREKAEDTGIPGKRPEFTCEMNENQIKIVYRGDVWMVFENQKWVYTGDIVSEKIFPVQEIRKIRRWKEAFKR